MVALLMCESCRNEDHEHCEKGEGSLPGMIGGGWICTCGCRHLGGKMKEWYMSSKKMTFWAQTSKGIVIDTALIARRFVGQPFKNLKAWLRRQGGFKYNCINEGEQSK